MVQAVNRLIDVAEKHTEALIALDESMEARRQKRKPRRRASPRYAQPHGLGSLSLINRIRRGDRRDLPVDPLVSHDPYATLETPEALDRAMRLVYAGGTDDVYREERALVGEISDEAGAVALDESTEEEGEAWVRA